jgi:hypothetical protein
MNILCVCLPLNLHYNENQSQKCRISKPTETMDKIAKACHII